MAQNETNKQEMKQEKITPESIIDAHKQHSGIDYYYKSEIIPMMEQYHLQSLQQLLDEASEELPTKVSIKRKVMRGANALSIGEWIKECACKIIVSLKTELRQISQANEINQSHYEVQREKWLSEIQQLKEELARREGLDGFRKYLTKNKFYSTLTHLDQYQASKTDKP